MSEKGIISLDILSDIADSIREQTGDVEDITPSEMASRIMSISTGGGLNDAAKEALLACFAHVAWTDEHGQDYVDALEDALYNEVYTVRTNLTKVTSNNNSSYAIANSPYTATLTATSDYLTYVKVTMGGVDITSEVYTPVS